MLRGASVLYNISSSFVCSFFFPVVPFFIFSLFCSSVCHISNCVGPIHFYGCGHRCGINGTNDNNNNNTSHNNNKNKNTCDEVFANLMRTTTIATVCFNLNVKIQPLTTTTVYHTMTTKSSSSLPLSLSLSRLTTTIECVQSDGLRNALVMVHRRHDNAIVIILRSISIKI